MSPHWLLLFALITVPTLASGRLSLFPIFQNKNKNKNRQNTGAKNPQPKFDVGTVDAGDRCIERQTCDDNAKWRTADGNCNNLQFPMWGQSQTALSKLTKASFSDGVHEPRLAASGKKLPSARVVSTATVKVGDISDKVNTLAVMTVGQLIAHDGAFIISTQTPAPESCCTQGGDNCFNIDVPSDDPFYGQFNVSCIPVVRTPSTASIGCSLKPEYTLTSVTHFIDASFVYGSSQAQSQKLREKSGGRLAFTLINGQVIPPRGPSTSTCEGDLCFKTGDDRVNQNAPLGSMQIIIFREHNRVADALAQLNPQWDDERLFQEAKRIVIAQWQIIVYRDYLPQIIGIRAAQQENLIPVSSGMSDDYDVFFNPSTTDEFTSSAFRIFHSQIPAAYCALNGTQPASGCPAGATNFSDTFNNPGSLGSVEGFTTVLKGLFQEPSDMNDITFSAEIVGKMFRHGKAWGQDLFAADVQRGRDTGLPPYNTYRTLCGRKAASNWRDFTDVIDKEDVAKLQKVYESPADVDMYVGGALEKKFPGSLVGPTFQCIIVDQFKRWKRGDRFFYDLEGFPHSMKQEQVNALRSTSLGRLLCDNANIDQVQQDIFLLRSPQVPCDQIPTVDLSPWKESA